MKHLNLFILLLTSYRVLRGQSYSTYTKWVLPDGAGGEVDDKMSAQICESFYGMTPGATTALLLPPLKSHLYHQVEVLVRGERRLGGGAIGNIKPLET